MGGIFTYLRFLEWLGVPEEFTFLLFVGICLLGAYFYFKGSDDGED
ncbi:MAG: hypothetical protein QGG50_00655 [Methanopyri archaeon]|nr:hypothetical protein [Methanopyri archaeon]